MADGDFIHIADVGAMIGDCGSIRTYLERRANSGKEFKELPPLRDSLDCRKLTPPDDQVRKWAVTNNMNEMSVNSMMPLLFAAALEHEDINEKLRDILTRIALYRGEDVAKNRDFLQGITDSANAPRRQQEEAQRKRMEKKFGDNRDYTNRIAEVENRLESRKQKFIRSMKKAIEVNGGVFEKLSESDREAFKFMNLINWVKITGNDIVVNEAAILKCDHGYCYGTLKKIKTVLESV